MNKLDRINVQAFIFTKSRELKVLILKRTPERSGYWQPVSGGIEYGEEPIETVKREVFEEVGLENVKNIIDLQYEFTYRETKNGELMNMKDICFAVEVDDIFKVQLSDEHEEYKWCCTDEAKQYLKWEHNLIALEKLISRSKSNRNNQNIERIVENFKLRNIDVRYFEKLEDTKKEILKLIPISASVGVGHSATLQKMNITEILMNRGNIVYDKELAKDKEEGKMLKKKALLTDWYISSSNAISVDGRIVNVDHSGNRVAAITFGPDNVIIVVGINKIVDTWQEAIKRVKNIACPLNAKRAGYNPPCVELGKCVDCTSSERVCNSLSIIEGQSVKDRMRVFIVNEELGF